MKVAAVADLKDNLFAELYTPMCTVYADTTKVARTPKHGPYGIYYEQDYEIILLCGLTELKAQISWIENVSIITVRVNHGGPSWIEAVLFTCVLLTYRV